jgi:hypothetical protein
MKELYRENLIKSTSDCTYDTSKSDMEGIKCGFECDDDNEDRFKLKLKDIISSEYLKESMTASVIDRYTSIRICLH